MTIEKDISFKQINVNGKECLLQIWDMAGQEKFKSQTLSYYRDAQGALIVYDSTNQDSYTDVGYWIENIDKYTKGDV